MYSWRTYERVPGALSSFAHADKVAQIKITEVLPKPLSHRYH
jgi:hypothetical protein